MTLGPEYRVLRESAIRALRGVTTDNVDLLYALKTFFETVKPIRRPVAWKDHNPAGIAPGLEAATTTAVHELSRRVPIGDWTALCNFVDWYPDNVIAMVADAISEVLGV